MTNCSRCGRAMDATETEQSLVTTDVGKAKVVWCSDCVLKSPPFINER